jgi:hypothetical protein
MMIAQRMPRREAFKTWISMASGKPTGESSGTRIDNL